MTKYIKRFKLILEQDDDFSQDPGDVSIDTDNAALDASMDDGSSADDFSVEPRIAGLRSKHMAKFQGIIEEFEKFARYLNSDDDDSVNKFLNAVDKDGSIFSGVSRETGKVTTVAESLAALSEAMRGYVLTGQRKQREQEAALAGF